MFFVLFFHQAAIKAQSLFILKKHLQFRGSVFGPIVKCTGPTRVFQFLFSFSTGALLVHMNPDKGSYIIYEEDLALPCSFPHGRHEQLCCAIIMVEFSAIPDLIIVVLPECTVERWSMDTSPTIT